VVGSQPSAWHRVDDPPIADGRLHLDSQVETDGGDEGDRKADTHLRPSNDLCLDGRAVEGDDGDESNDIDGNNADRRRLDGLDGPGFNGPVVESAHLTSYQSDRCDIPHRENQPQSEGRCEVRPSRDRNSAHGGSHCNRTGRLGDQGPLLGVRVGTESEEGEGKRDEHKDPERALCSDQRTDGPGERDTAVQEGEDERDGGAGEPTASHQIG